MPPPKLGGWAASYAMVPFLRSSAMGGLELFFSSRDELGRSSTGRAALMLSGSGSCTVGDPTLVLGSGALGAFDDSGAMGSCLVKNGRYEHLYYIGWTLGRTVPFSTYIGMAVSEDGGRTFERVSAGPVIGRSRSDPFLATSPWVLVEDGRWRMWYTSGVRWASTGAGPRHYYRITYAESSDGIEWKPTELVCIDFKDEEEYAIARPCVLRDGALYKMWFCYRGAAYRIGYAESADGLDWTRRDSNGGLGPAGQGWDSRSVEYGFVFDWDGTRWMLYNGNDYGATGIGLARWEASE
jgi:hypothetical protein